MATKYADIVRPLVRREKDGVIAWCYYHYLLNLSLPLLEPWEIRLWNSMVVLFLGMAAYTTYLFLPGHLAMWGRLFSYLLDPEQTDPPHSLLTQPEAVHS